MNPINEENIKECICCGRKQFSDKYEENWMCEDCRDDPTDEEGFSCKPDSVLEEVD